MNPMIEKYKKLILERAESLLCEKHKIDLVNDLRETLHGRESDVYSLQVYLSQLAELLNLKPIVGFINEDPDASLDPLINGFRAKFWLERFRQLLLYKLSLTVADSEEFFDNYSVLDTDILDKCWALCGQWCLNPNEVDRDIYEWMSISRSRGDFDFYVDSPDFTYAMNLDLLDLFFSEEKQEAKFSQLAQYEPLRFLGEEWINDEAFIVGMNKACDWHLMKCNEGLSDSHLGYYIEPYSLFPTWIIALVKYRERVLGKTVVPSHELFQFAYSVFNLPVFGTDELILKEIREGFDSYYGNVKVDMVEYWSQFSA